MVHDGKSTGRELLGTVRGDFHRYSLWMSCNEAELEPVVVHLCTGALAAS